MIKWFPCLYFFKRIILIYTFRQERYLMRNKSRIFTFLSEALYQEYELQTDFKLERKLNNYIT